jgi:diguanylate cyclase (GGDEF)-like protein
MSTSDDLRARADGGRASGEVERLRAEIAHLQERVEQLDRLAHEDALTGLPNRRGFMRHLGRLIDRIQRYGDHGALLFVDIDGLKVINDSLGHHGGDAALIQVAAQLVEGVRASDCVGRIGGDEFAVLLEHADEASARETAARLVDRIAEHGFVHDEAVVPLSVAIGMSLILPSDKPEDVIVRADGEMYAVKTSA